MTTLREFILAGSSLVTGNTVRDHINNQSIGTGTVIIGGIRTANIQQNLSANIANSLSANISQTNLTVDKPVSLSASINQKLEASICQ